VCAPDVDPDTVVLSPAPLVYGLACTPFSPIPARQLGRVQGVVVVAAPHALPPPAWSCIRSYREMRRFCAEAPDGFYTVYTLYLQPYGQQKPTAMYVAIGGRGDVARAIIDSIRPAPGHGAPNP